MSEAYHSVRVSRQQLGQGPGARQKSEKKRKTFLRKYLVFLTDEKAEAHIKHAE